MNNVRIFVTDPIPHCNQAFSHQISNTTPQQPILAKYITKYTCIQTPNHTPEFGLEKGRYSTNISILRYDNLDTTLNVKHTIVQSARAPDHNSQIIKTTQDIPSSITSVDIDCRHIVEKAGEGTGWIIIEAPRNTRYRLKQFIHREEIWR